MALAIYSRGLCRPSALAGLRTSGHFLNSLPKPSQFSTSSPRKFHPALLALIKPVSRLLGVFIGKGFRRWWLRLPESQKSNIKGQLKQNKRVIGGISAATVALITYFGYESVSD